MVILIFRKFCFQPRSPGGLFLRNYICFIRSSCGLPHRVSQTSSHSTGTSISPETHTRTHGQARTVKYRGRCPTRRRTNRQPLGEQGTSTSANCVPAKRGRTCCRREVRHQLTAAATGALLLVAGMTCSPQGKHEPLRMRLRIGLRPVVAVVTKDTRTKRAATATAAVILMLTGRRRSSYPGPHASCSPRVLWLKSTGTMRQGKDARQRSVTLRMNMMAIRYAVFLCVGLRLGHTTHTGR